EVGACAAWLRANAAFELDPEVVVEDGETHAELHYRPVGVVGAVGPWNWPMMISVWQFAPALKMGNTVVLKPSEYTPLSVQALEIGRASCRERAETEEGTDVGEQKENEQRRQ